MLKSIIDCQYFGSILYFLIINKSKEVVVDLGENFKKSTYRNRFYIPGPNGVTFLSVPLKKGKNQRCNMNSIEISYDHPWQNLHWKTLCSCYRRSPFFEYYEDELKILLFKKNLKLVDLNISIIEWIFKTLSLENVNINYSENYIENITSELTDYRSKLKPNIYLHEEFINDYSLPKYIQVFEEKIGFKKNMSVLDLIFNEGPNSSSYFI
tara:strand:+ start:615 stop:1244 length:630 start_codon:yes stop_codon:yes gene_type:complete